MSSSVDPARPKLQSDRLLAFLALDPHNPQLLADAVTALFDEGALDRAAETLDRHEGPQTFSPALLNLRGLIALARQQFEVAAAVFEQLLAGGHDDPAVRFNLAWCRVMSRDYNAALALLDDAAVAAAPAAAALKVQALHHLGRLEEALAWGAEAAERRPDDRALMSALALVAVDCKETALARIFATKAGDSHEGLSTLGTLALDDNQIDGSLALFDRALAVYPDSARALLGKGLALMARNEPANAAQWLDRGAGVFGDHIGSWVAAGWAHFVAGDLAAARADFERALAIDESFAETHGALAVLDITEQHLDSARRRTETALRLDRHCFSAALAKSLLLSSEGDEVTAARIREMAMNSRIGPDGLSLAQAMAGLNAASRKG